MTDEFTLGLLRRMVPASALLDARHGSRSGRAKRPRTRSPALSPRSAVLVLVLTLATVAGAAATLPSSAFAAPASATATPSPDPAKLVRHVLLLAIAASTPPDRLAAIEAAMAKLPSQVPDVVAGESGRDVTAGARTQGFTHAFVVTFRDLEAVERYRSHPAHEAFVALTTPHLARPPLVLDYVVE